MQTLTDDMKDYIHQLASVGIAPEDIRLAFQRKFKDAPTLSAKDVQNLRPASNGGSSDAYTLLSRLLELQAADSRWFVRWKLDPVSKRLTHLFWMSPRMRELAEDCYQLVFHDNTYKSNKFNLPCGLFSGVNRQGQTVLLAIALSAKEGTADYQWQYEMDREAAGTPPNLIFTDADPGATAAVSEVFPDALHLWCL